MTSICFLNLLKPILKRTKKHKISLLSSFQECKEILIGQVNVLCSHRLYVCRTCYYYMSEIFLSQFENGQEYFFLDTCVFQSSKCLSFTLVFKKILIKERTLWVEILIACSTHFNAFSKIMP